MIEDILNGDHDELLEMTWGVDAIYILLHSKECFVFQDNDNLRITNIGKTIISLNVDLKDLNINYRCLCAALANITFRDSPISPGVTRIVSARTVVMDSWSAMSSRKVITDDFGIEGTIESYETYYT